MIGLRQQGFAPLVSTAWWDILASRALAILMMAAIIPMQMRREGLTTSDLGYQSRWTFRHLAWGIGAGASIWFSHNGLLDWAARSVGPGWINTGVMFKDEVFRSTGPIEIFGGWFGAAVMSPIIEETVYRASLITSLCHRWGSGPTREAAYVLTSALLFAAAHELSHPLYTAAYAVTGGCLALLYIKTRSLNAAIVAHSMINTIFCYRAFH
jgi:membrane protease YdiL (CAAX protease family)